MNVQLQHVYILEFLYFQSQIPAEKKSYSQVSQKAARLTKNNKNNPLNTFYIKKCAFKELPKTSTFTTMYTIPSWRA